MLDLKSRFGHTPVMAAFCLAATIGLAVATLGQTTPTASPSVTGAAATSPATPLTSGWVLLKEGEAEGTIEVDAKHPTNPSPHLLKIAVTKYPDISKGRLGAKNTSAGAVTDGTVYEITFSGTKEGTSSYGVGLVFSLETDDGKVLARTTLPEIGRGGGGRRGSGGGVWLSYQVSLRAHGSAPNAHLTITAMEPYPVWLDNIVMIKRTSAQ